MSFFNEVQTAQYVPYNYSINTPSVSSFLPVFA